MPVALAVAALLAQLQPLPPQLVALDSDEGQKLLFESTARRAYFPLSAQFVTQQTPSFCGVASAVMVLNALPLQAPVAEEFAPFRAFTQKNVFAATAGGLPPEHVANGGLTVEQLAWLLKANHADAQPSLAQQSTLERFRDEAVRALGQPDRHVLVDFLRAELGQDFGAHWSPLAAYHARSDRFLVLDVARVRYPPYWVRAADLFRAMATHDLDSGKSRGWIVVGLQPGAPGRAEIPSMKRRLFRFAGAAAALIFVLGAGVGALIARLWMRRASAPH